MNGQRIISPEKKVIALIAHDNCKASLISWAKANREKLMRHSLCATGTTAGLLCEKVGLEVEAYKSGPLGGDIQIGGKIVEEKIDLMIFFWDPLTAQPHDPDVKALLRIAVLYNIPVAMNSATADFILSSEHMDEEYAREVFSFTH